MDLFFFKFSGENTHSNYSIDLNKLSQYTFQNFLLQFRIQNHKSSNIKFSIQEIAEFIIFVRKLLVLKNISTF